MKISTGGLGNVRPSGVLAATILLIGAGLSGCNPSGSAEQDAEPQMAVPKVSIIEVQPESVTVPDEMSGRTAAYMIAQVRPQVGGIINERRFAEGSLVEEGQVLYQIDPAIFEADLASAEAAVAESEANLEINRLTVTRYRNLLKSKSISQQDYDDANAAYRQALASVAVNQAALKRAQINLDYTRVSAPISGRIGRSSVTAGALVTTNQAEALAVVQQLDPIYVDLSQSSAQVLRVRKRFMQGVPPDDIGVDVRLILEDGEHYAETGKLEFSEVTVSEGTGSITLRAVFPNPDGLLLPGMFVRATVEAGAIDDGILIPPRALSRNFKGQPMVMIVGEGSRVEQRMLGKTELVRGRWLVEGGLNSGDKVIVSGLQHIRPGMPVQVVASTGSSAAEQQER